MAGVRTAAAQGGGGGAMKSSDMTSQSTPMLSVAGAVATVTLNRPAHRNRLEDEDLRVLLRHFDQVGADQGIRVLVLSANTQDQPRPIFCAGYHVGDFDHTDAEAPAFDQVADALAALRPVTIAGINGSVYGGATDLVLSCDLRIGVAGAEFRMPAAALGLHYYASGVRRYVAVLGSALAKRAFLTAQAIPLEELMAAGVLVSIAEAAQFDAALEQLATAVSLLAPLAAQGLKQSMNEIAAGNYDVDRVRAREQLTLQSKDFSEGRAAFKERRTPRFSGG